MSRTDHDTSARTRSKGGVAGTGAGLLLVLNKSDHDLAFVDPVTLAVVARVATGRAPHELAVTPDQRRAFVSNYGMYAVFREGERVDEPGNTISVVDLDRRAVVDTFDLGEYRKPHGIWVSRDGRHVWVTCEAAQAVLELDAATGVIARVWRTGQDVSHMLVPTPDESRLYVSNIRSGSVTIIDRRTNAVRTLVTGAGAEGIDITPDGAEVWVTNRAANTLSVIATATDTMLETFESGGEMPIRVKFTPDGREAWVSIARSNELAVFDVRVRRRLTGIPVGVMPVGIQLSPEGARIFVANSNDDRITVVDRAERRVVGTFTTGHEPDGMAWVAASPPSAGPSVA
jgi:YVTN family beta-propeller protein